jgi:hypothetical protein
MEMTALMLALVLALAGYAAGRVEQRQVAYAWAQARGEEQR